MTGLRSLPVTIVFYPVSRAYKQQKSQIDALITYIYICVYV